MSTIWLMQTQQFHKEVIAHLTKMGIQVGYICSTPELLLSLADIVNHECILHSSWDAVHGQPPASPDQTRAQRIPADAVILEKLLPYESIALQMLERLNYPGLRIHDLRRYYLNYVAMWRGLLETNPPDAIVFQLIPHMGYDYVLYALCQVYGIRTLIIEITFLPDRLMLIERIDKMPQPPFEQGFTTSSPSSTKQIERPSGRKHIADDPADPDNYYNSFNRPIKLEGAAKLSWIRLLKMVPRPRRGIIGELIHQLPRLFKPVLFNEYALVHPQPRYISVLWQMLVDSIYRLSLMLFYEAQTEAPDFEGNYIYFPLHYEPERSTNPMGGWSTDQLLVLDILIHSLPPGWLVYVKEHPWQFTSKFIPAFRLSRNRQFYQALCSHGPGKIRLIGLKESADNLITHSRCVATITGTSGWEAVQNGVPVLVFGTPWYVNCPGVHAISSVDECTTVLNQIAAGQIKVAQEQVSAYLQWIKTEVTFRGYYGDVFQAESSLTAAENGRTHAEAIVSRLVTTPEMAGNQTRSPDQRKKRLSVEDINRRLGQIEKTYNLLQYKVDGWCIWPVLRFYVGRVMEDLQLTASDMVSLSWLGELVLVAIQDIPRLLFIKPAGYLINNYSSALADRGGPLYRDIFFDDVFEAVDDIFKLEIININGFRNRRKAALIKNDLTTTLFRLGGAVLARAVGPSYIRPIAQQLSSCLQRELGLTAFTTRWVEIRLREFYWLKKSYGWLLRRVRPEFLLKASIGERALVAAAKELGIEVIEFQHGYTDRHHYEYSWPASAVAYKSSMPIPDRLFLYGENAEQELSAKGFWGETLRVVGRVHLDRYRQRRIGIDKANVCTLVFSSQGVDVEKTIAFLADFLKAAQEQLDLRLYIKLHPGYETSTDLYEAAFQNDPRVHVFLGHEEPSTFELLSQAHIHLSISSSCHYEALALGVPTVILPFALHEIVLPLYEAGHAFLVHTPGELLDIVLQWKELEVPDDIGEYYFKSGALNNIKKELGISV
jgi:hypothetical protein